MYNMYIIYIGTVGYMDSVSSETVVGYWHRQNNTRANSRQTLSHWHGQGPTVHELYITEVHHKDYPYCLEMWL